MVERRDYYSRTHEMRGGVVPRVAHPETRLRIASLFVILFGCLLVVRLFDLMVIEHGFYTALAEDAQDTSTQLFPERGEIFVHEKDGGEVPLALNKDVYTVFVDTRSVTTDESRQAIVNAFAEAFHYDDAKKAELLAHISVPNDPYVPIEKEVEADIATTLRDKKLAGVGFARFEKRFYPEGPLESHILGFLGKTSTGADIGHYGVEGYWQKELAGVGGFFEGASSAKGAWIALAGRNFRPPVDGADIVLTIDRTLQYVACERLKRGMGEYGATGGSLIIMDPKTGAILAMCNVPDFNPNEYGKVSSGSVYNNDAIFTSYEPGSIFKPIAMAAALNEGAVGPHTAFFDSGSSEGLCEKPIYNAGKKAYGQTDMAGILKDSINTGMVFTVKQLGKNKLQEYINRFGFGVKSGIELDKEEGGDVSSLSIHKSNTIDCYGATASFGQGLTATPLQMVTAYAAIANGGVLMKPYIIDEVRYSDGHVDRTEPKEIRRVIDKHTSSVLSAMLVGVIDFGHGKKAGVEGYYVAGKTGTAQIPGPGGYTTETNQSFVGFVPVDNPKFVMIVKYEKPQRTYAESTAVPVFGDIASFALQYYQVPPER